MTLVSISAARVNLLLTPIAAILAITTSILVARWLGPETYADYATLMALLTWLLILAESGCNSGLGRFLNAAALIKARSSLYRTLQTRRWVIAIGLTTSLIWLGPLWANVAGLSASRWQPASFILVGLLAAFMLHGQLASTAMLAAYRHGRVLLLSQSMMIARALILGVLASTIREPITLLEALLGVAMIEAILLHQTATAGFRRERDPLPKGMANSAQLHGLVAVFDKLTTALSGAPFLLLALAGVHGRGDLAMLAVAADLLQRVLAVVGMPISNLVLPMLNESRSNPTRYRSQVQRLGGLMTVLFSVAAAGVAAIVPFGLPLLLGQTYAPAVPVALIWLLPLFFEAGVRMVWGAAIFTLDRHRWLMGFNLISAAAYMLVIFAAREINLTSLIILLGVLRIVMSLIFLARAASLNLLPSDSRPLGVVLAAAAACVFSLGVQVTLDQTATGFQLLAGIAAYGLAILAMLRWLPLIPNPSYEALCQIAGKHRAFLTYVLPNQAEVHRRA